MLDSRVRLYKMSQSWSRSYQDWKYSTNQCCPWRRQQKPVQLLRMLHHKQQWCPGRRLADAYLWHWQLHPICLASSEPWEQILTYRLRLQEVIWNWFMSILGQPEYMVILKGTKAQSDGKAYSSQAFSTCGQAAQYRVVLVDGRFRVAGFLKMLKSMAPQDLNSTQTLHDFERPEYPVIEEFAELVGRRHSFTQSSLPWGVRRACKIWFCNSRMIRPCNDISLTVHLARVYRYKLLQTSLLCQPNWTLSDCLRAKKIVLRTFVQVAHGDGHGFLHVFAL